MVMVMMMVVMMMDGGYGETTRTRCEYRLYRLSNWMCGAGSGFLPPG